MKNKIIKNILKVIIISISIGILFIPFDIFTSSKQTQKIEYVLNNNNVIDNDIKMSNNNDNNIIYMNSKNYKIDNLIYLRLNKISDGLYNITYEVLYKSDYSNCLMNTINNISVVLDNIEVTFIDNEGNKTQGIIYLNKYDTNININDTKTNINGNYFIKECNITLSNNYVSIDINNINYTIMDNTNNKKYNSYKYTVI